MQVFLETERLILRRFTEADGDHLFALDNDPDVMRFLNGGTPTPRDVIQNDILPGFLHYDEDASGNGAWAAIEKTSGDFLGWFSFRLSGETSYEFILGYRLHKAAWGKGYATEGSGALIRKGFTELDVQRVVATTYEENIGSRRVMEKVGMKLVRTFRITADDLVHSGSFHSTSPEVWDGDDVEYALERADWERQEVLRG
ncbi:MAG: N-acetyltransferase [Chloroflexi bacterium AL-W]|nr:N-acetyltransferase [Chloroflexi bacterium AL-N1]NOK65003.1 N-acetyltransferase [Chloroflexi bacterium AL-N10]NOK76773.1 N-acetyltransferase [Chloroflexi bacterium AL-N5]NOK84665.1 N-acetyltransferase [Chloroflexi bacterium AL-W]NOK86511.1 N-acetyltransferase [Chloroflexi bacterium AL-N15]